MKTDIFSAGGEQLVLRIIFFGAAGARKNGTVKTTVEEFCEQNMV
jgi:hypothetical protein